MKILIRKSDNVVIHADDSMLLYATGAHGAGWIDRNYTTANSTLADAVLPALWQGAVWSYIGGVWAVVDTATYAIKLAELKTAKKSVFKTTLDTLATTSNTITTVEGWVVDAKRTDLDNLKNYRDFLVSTSATTAIVRMHDNSNVSMPIARLQSLINEVIAAGLGLFQHKWALESAVDAATTADQVNAVVW